MSKLKTIAIAIGTTIAMAGIASAQNTAQIEEVGDWAIETWSMPTSELDPLCVLRSPTTDETFIRLYNPLGAGPTVRGQGNLQVYTNRIISDAENAILPHASIRIDGTERWNKDITWLKRSDKLGVLSVQLDDSIDALIRPFATGRESEVVVSTPDGKEHSFKVKLAGSHRALTVYEKCLAKVRVAPE